METPSQSQKAFNATKEGQMAMCQSAMSVSTVLIINNKVRSLGGAFWQNEMIETANAPLLEAIKSDLIDEYNRLVTAK